MMEKADVIALTGGGRDPAPLVEKAVVFLAGSLKAMERPLEEDHVERIEQALEFLRGRDLPVEVEEVLFWFHEYSGKFDRAENMLFDLLERGKDVSGAGRAFYERLMRMSDEEIERGNLTRNEVEEGREELVRRSG